MSFTPSDLASFAALARLSVPAEEAEALAGDLDRILSYAGQLQKIPTEGVPPTTHPLATHADVLRPDEPRSGLSRDEALAAAPAAEEGLFRVPRIVG